MKHWDDVCIGDFTGPLDLLLAMIRDKKMSIKDVNLLLITNQYLDYLESQRALDIEIASEYLDVAAQLIEMKSKYLLAGEIKNAETLDEIYVDLLEQLTRYEQIKTVTEKLMVSQQEYFETFSKQKSNIKLNSKLVDIKNGEKLVSMTDLDLEDFAQIYRQLVGRAPIADPDWDGDFDGFNFVETKELSPQEVAKTILSVMKTDRLKVWKLPELIPKEAFNLKNLIATFLAVLDLVRYQVVLINQIDDVLWVQFTPSAQIDDAVINLMEVQINEKFEEQQGG